MKEHGKTVELAKEGKREIPYVLVASNTGRTAQAVLMAQGDLQAFADPSWAREPGHDEMEPQMRQALQEQEQRCSPRPMS